MTCLKISPSSKISSLLALGGAVFALPHAGQAQIHSFTLNETVGFGADSSFTLDLPGANDLSFNPRNTTTFGKWVTAYNSLQKVQFRAFQTAGANAFYFAQAAPAGKFFHSIGASTKAFAAVAASFGPASYDHQYLAFRFQDTSDGNKTKYGWLQASTVSSSSPQITFEGWAYQDDGTEIAMGTAVPEPQAAVMATGAALILGAAGLRAWRKRRASLAAT